MAQLASRRLWQLQRLCPTVTAVSSILKRNVTTAHAAPMLKAGYDVENPDMIFGSRSWRWLRPATSVESDLDEWNRHISRVAFPYITINADREITEDMWRQMLIHLRNQMPNLKMVILPNNNEKWVCHADDMDISLKIYENIAPEEMIKKILDDPFRDGPWTCTVVKASDEDICLFPEEKKSKPYQYYWFLSTHHALLDGYSQALMVRFAMNNLNVVLAGKDIDDRVQVCQSRRGSETTAKMVKLKETLKNNPKWFQKEKERLLSTFKAPLLNEAFPAPNVTTPKTSTLMRTADPLVLNAFHKQCKSAGVSVTNGLVAIVNTAMVEMVQDAGILRDSYHLTLNTNVDLRRYMNIHPQTATGMLVGAMHQSMHPTKNVRKEFWEHAKIVQDDAKTLLKTDGAFVESAIREMALPRLDLDVIFSSSNTTKMQRDFTINNLNDVTPILYDSKRHKHAVVTSAIILQGLHNFNPMMLSLSKFRGNTQFALAYATNFLSQESAEELKDRIIMLIRDKAEIK